jgi:uncharacterized membrane protein YfcA
MTLQYWYVFPIAILIATIAMASGVGGATFFSPLFILALGLPPEVAIGTGLITEVFGFASGLFAYIRKRLIDFSLGLTLLVVTIPLALLGTWVAGLVDADILKVILGVGLAEHRHLHRAGRHYRRTIGVAGCQPRSAALA